MAKSHRLRLSEMRAVFRLLGDVREMAASGEDWQAGLADGVCELIGARQGTCLRWEGFGPRGR